MVLPPEAAAELSRKLLAFPPVKVLTGAKPVIIYFRTDADRAEFMALFHETAPGMIQIEAPDITSYPETSLHEARAVVQRSNSR
jgi:hypothetical protein